MTSISASMRSVLLVCVRLAMGSGEHAELPGIGAEHLVAELPPGVLAHQDLRDYWGRDRR
jgi:hypothetical protein